VNDLDDHSYITVSDAITTRIEAITNIPLILPSTSTSLALVPLVSGSVGALVGGVVSGSVGAFIGEQAPLVSGSVGAFVGGVVSGGIGVVDDEEVRSRLIDEEIKSRFRKAAENSPWWLHILHFIPGIGTITAIIEIGMAWYERYKKQRAQ